MPWTGNTTAMATLVGMPSRVTSLWAGTIGSGHARAVGMASSPWCNPALHHGLLAVRSGVGC